MEDIAKTQAALLRVVSALRVASTLPWHDDLEASSQASLSTHEYASVDKLQSIAQLLEAAFCAADALDVERHMRQCAAALLQGAWSDEVNSSAGSELSLEHAADLMARFTLSSARRMSTSKAQAAEMATEAQNKQRRVLESEREAAMLRDELQRQRQARQDEVTAMDAQISAAWDELDLMRAETSAELAAIRGAGEGRRHASAHSHADAMAEGQAALSHAQATLAAMRASHAGAEDGARKRRARACAEAEVAAHDHEAAVGAVQGAIDATHGAMREDARELGDLGAYYRRVDAAEREVAAEAAAEADRLLRTVTLTSLRQRHVCTRLKRWWRVARVAKAARDKAAAAAAGGSGGKKGAAGKGGKGK